MKIYCPNCFYPNESYQKNFEICKEPIDWKDESYEDELIRALSHKDPRIVLRVVEILSHFKSNKSRKALIKIINILNQNCPACVYQNKEKITSGEAKALGKALKKMMRG